MTVPAVKLIPVTIPAITPPKQERISPSQTTLADLRWSRVEEILAEPGSAA
ncbi:MAG: hypothetical protein MH252_17695 [Thermosynechococcaceae cyanobacterium MS004]|nr:hypothetical protein [Thermosynechococcaceae cyanobacterium MS004]